MWGSAHKHINSVHTTTTSTKITIRQNTPKSIPTKRDKVTTTTRSIHLCANSLAINSSLGDEESGGSSHTQ